MEVLLKQAKNMAGKVYLIGAGPGDPELMTLKAVKAMQQAEVILIDDLVNREILQHAPQARVIEVGKRGGCKSTPQHFINRMMAALAEQGHTVARLKGGDPFLFGRGGEEMLEMRAAGIEVEVIPGVTSGIAAPATLGIPVTHRTCTHGVSFVTGHLQDGRSGQNWQALAQSGTTLVIYMGMKHLASITSELLAAGMPPDTPAAAIQNGSLPQQRHVTSTLSLLVTAVQQAGLASPVIIVVGNVVRLAHDKELLPSISIAA